MSTRQLQKLTPHQEDLIWKAKAYAKEITLKLSTKPNSTATANPAFPQKGALPTTATDAQTLLIFCRIYVGSVDFSLHERHLRAIFSSFGPIRTLTMSYDATERRHKGFAFIEYENPEAAQLAVELMDGVALSGRQLKVGRPANYPPEGGKRLVPQPPKGRVYVANVHEVVSEADLRDIFGEFGPVKAVSLPPEQITKRHRGYGYVEYEHADDANNAIVALNSLDLGGKPLRIGKCVIGGPMPTGMGDSKVLPKGILSIADAINKSVAGVGTNAVTTRATTNITTKVKETSTLLLENMAAPLEIDDPELKIDIQTECSKYAPVHSVNINLFQNASDEAQVRVFVVFSTSEGASRVAPVFDGRWFGGRKVHARVYPQEAFERGAFDQ